MDWHDCFDRQILFFRLRNPFWAADLQFRAGNDERLMRRLDARLRTNFSTRKIKMRQLTYRGTRVILDDLLQPIRQVHLGKLGGGPDGGGPDGGDRILTA